MYVALAWVIHSDQNAFKMFHRENIKSGNDIQNAGMLLKFLVRMLRASTCVSAVNL